MHTKEWAGAICADIIFGNHIFYGKIIFKGKEGKTVSKVQTNNFSGSL